MVLSFLLYFYCRNHNLLTVGFMPVPPGHRQQITSTISAIELYMEAEIVIVKIEKHPQEMLLFTTNISFLHFLGLMFLRKKGLNNTVILK